MRRPVVTLLLSTLLVAFGWSVVRARQDACQAPPPAASKEPNIFSIEQEGDLGDAAAERFEAWLRVIEDPAVTAKLDQLGAAIASHLPRGGVKIRFKLIDIPDANAFAMPGGRVYISRKMIAFAESEDELAGVIGHELGHLAARQQVIDVTRQLREVLGVNEVGDRADVIAKYNRLMDNAARKPGVFSGSDREGREQLEADRLGLFLVTAAGYDPKAFVSLFDRLAATGGKTGTVLSRMFGTTNPDAKRLGEMMKNAAAVPASCTAPPAAGRDAAFRSWQSAVTAYSDAGREAVLPGLVSRKSLSALRPEVTRARFSPDGRFLLAQDDAGITVLTRQPFGVHMRIDSLRAQPAQFTPDSTALVFHTADLRVERWDLATKRLTSAREVYRQDECSSTALSPDGRVLACLVAEKSELSLIDVDTAQSLFVKKGFETFNPQATLAMLFGGIIGPRTNSNVNLVFSPDGRFFIAGAQGFQSSSAVGYDLLNHAALSLKGSSRNMVTTAFAFIGPDRFVGLNIADAQKSGIVKLPSCDVEQNFALIPGALEGATKGDFVFIRPFQKAAVGIFDVAKRAVTKSSATEAIDVYADAFVAERGTGDLGIYSMEGNQLQASTSLPTTLLAGVRTAAVSADFRWVALAIRTRAAMWDATTGERVGLVRDFDGAFIDGNGSLFADMPKAGADPRGIMRLDGPTRTVGSVAEIKDPYAGQYGRRLMVIHPLPPNTMVPTGIEFEVKDIQTGSSLWKKAYAKNPPDDFWPDQDSDALVLSWKAESPAGREVIRLDPGLRSRANLGDIQGDYVLEVLDAESGAVRGRMLVETGKGSFHIHRIVVNGDRIFVTDSLDRVLVYSLATGEQAGYAVGEYPLATADLLAVETGSGRIHVYDLKTMRRKTDLVFSRPVVFKAFSPDGARLFVLTADQETVIVNVK